MAESTSNGVPTTYLQKKIKENKKNLLKYDSFEIAELPNTKCDHFA